MNLNEAVITFLDLNSSKETLPKTLREKEADFKDKSRLYSYGPAGVSVTELEELFELKNKIESLKEEQKGSKSRFNEVLKTIKSYLLLIPEGSLLIRKGELGANEDCSFRLHNGQLVLNDKVLTIESKPNISGYFP